MYWLCIWRQEEQEDTNSEKWFPPIVSYYETYVMHIRTMEESKDDSVHFLKEYLINDLRVHIFEVLKKKKKNAFFTHFVCSHLLSKM